MNAAKIACNIQDDALRSRLNDLLARKGFECEHFFSDAALMRSLRHRTGWDLALIDVPQDPTAQESLMSWLHCRVGEKLPVVLTSAHWDARQVASALEAGADDYVGHDYDEHVLVARLRALLRRSSGPGATRVRLNVAGFTLDQSSSELLDRGAPVDLTPREFALAWLLFANPGARPSRDAISLALWGTDKDIANRAIEQHVYKLRKKLNLNEQRGVVIRTTYAQGYRLDLFEAQVWSMPGLASQAMVSALGAGPSAAAA